MKVDFVISVRREVAHKRQSSDYIGERRQIPQEKGSTYLGNEEADPLPPNHLEV